MATKNLVDDTSTTVTTATPGVQLDLRYRTTLGRASRGVPVRFWVYAESTVTNDTGTVQILDSSGAAMLTIPITGSTPRWYVTDGYLPALDAKYDAHYGGNTSGTLKVYAFTVHEFADISPNEGVLSASIGNFTLSAAGTVATGGINGDLTQSIGSFTLLATGTVANSWTVDATSGKGTPADATEWAAVIAAAGLTGVVSAPEFLFLLQEASGNAADTIGGIGTLTANNAPTYQQTITGWTRKAVKTTSGTSNQGFYKDPASALLAPNTNSYALCTYAIIDSTPAAVRTLFKTTDGEAQMRITATPRITVISGGGNSATGALDPTGQVRPFWQIVNVTGNATNGGSDAEKITPVHGDPSSAKGFGLGGFDATAAAGGYLYAFGWLGTEAEISTANLKLILQTLGWTVGW